MYLYFLLSCNHFKCHVVLRGPHSHVFFSTWFEYWATCPTDKLSDLEQVTTSLSLTFPPSRLFVKNGKFCNTIYECKVFIAGHFNKKCFFHIVLSGWFYVRNSSHCYLFHTSVLNKGQETRNKNTAQLPKTVPNGGGL